MMLVAMLLVVAATPSVDDYVQKARPILLAAGCANSSCHGSTLAPLKLIDRPLSPEEAAAERDLVVTAGEGGLKSVLLRKAFGELDHIGGKNLDARSCEVAHLVAWLGGAPATCALVLRSREPPAGMKGPFPPELDGVIATCATASCHATRAPVLTAGPGARDANAAALSPFGNVFAPTDSPLFKAVLGKKKGHPVAFKDPRGLDAQRLFGWMSAERVARPARLPDVETLEHAVVPIFDKRGCLQSTCHGSYGSGLVLGAGPQMALTNYFRLLPRIADGSLRAKTTNTLAHGGGLVLAKSQDCLARQVDAWIEGKAVTPCPPRAPPPRALYDAVVQPAFETLKCTSCHAKGPGGFTLVDAHGDDATLAANYAQVSRFIDLDFPPVSHVLLRVREPCLQSRIVAWVAGKAQPSCEVKKK